MRLSMGSEGEADMAIKEMESAWIEPPEPWDSTLAPPEPEPEMYDTFCGRSCSLLACDRF